MRLLLLAILLHITLAEAIDEYRLPETQIPSEYEIDLYVSNSVFQGNETSFNGSVMIKFQVTESTNQIKLHSAVTIHQVRLLQEVISVLNYTLNSTTEILTIDLTTPLNIFTEYALVVEYTGQLDTSNMLGFYRSQYKDPSGTTKYLVTTQFESTYARKAFPCFDEPRYKATFVLTITYPKGLQAISNTPINTESVVNGTDNNTITVFTKTPLMSTYLVAFTVSDFNCTLGGNVDDIIPHRVCSRPETTPDRSLAAEFGTKIMTAYGQHLGYKYGDMNISKIDQLAIPDFNAGAMENWGMVTYKEYALLYNVNHTSNLMKQKVIAIIAHEFAHMWFGDLVTLDWWDYTFLNEGFARYFQYFILTKIPELVEYEMDKQFVVEQQQTAFLVDALMDSDPLTSKSTTPSEISSKFGSISYNKGASVIRMLENIMGSDNFTSSLKDYLRQKLHSSLLFYVVICMANVCVILLMSNVVLAFSSSVPEKLWNVMANYTPSENLPSNVSFAEVIDSWSNRAGFPLVTVSSVGNDIILTQKRFSYTESDDTQWYIPISFTRSGDAKKFDNVSADIWMTPNSTFRIPNVLDNNEWIILNNKASAYYRVNYDTSLWNKIQLVLQNNHTLIDRINRAQIVDDSLNLARSNEIRYSEAFQTLAYLRYETCYYPWYSAIEGFNYLLLRLGENSVLGEKVRSMVLDLMEGVKTDMSLENVNDTQHLHTLKLQKVLNLACKLGDESCVRISKDLFRDNKNGTVSINKNVRSIVYCNALRYSDNIDSDWEYLWGKLKTTTQANELSNLITSLGCTRSTEHLKLYLQQSVNASSGIKIQDLPDLWASVYGNSAEGVDVAFDFLSENHLQIYNYFSKASNLMPAIIERFTSEAQLQKLQEFIDKQPSNSSIRLASEKALAKAQRNFQWVSNIKEDLERHFGISPSGATAMKVTMYIMLSIIVFPLMILH